MSTEEKLNRIDRDFADKFAGDWIASWNAHDLDRVLSHYADEFEMTSPVIIQVTGESSVSLHGKKAVGDYWAKALQMIPDLHFEWIATLIGVDSIAISYRGAMGQPAIEVFHFGADRKVVRAFAHYGV